MSGRNISLVLFLAEESNWLDKQSSDIYGCTRRQSTGGLDL